jgi:hypothetical protein
MRSKCKITMMVLVGALALGAVASASASAALPEMVNKEGKALVKSKFTGADVEGTLVFAIEAWGALECTGFKSSGGEVTGLQSSHAKWTWTGCSADDGKYESEGAKEGEFVIPELKSQLVYEVYEKGAPLEPALLLTFAKELSWGNALVHKHLKGSLLVLMSKSEGLETGFNIKAEQAGSKQSGSGEYEETRGGEVKKASLVSTFEGAENFKNSETALSFFEKRTFEEEFKFNW